MSSRRLLMRGDTPSSSFYVLQLIGKVILDVRPTVYSGAEIPAVIRAFLDVLKANGEWEGMQQLIWPCLHQITWSSFDTEQACGEARRARKARQECFFLTYYLHHRLDAWQKHLNEHLKYSMWSVYQHPTRLFVINTLYWGTQRKSLTNPKQKVPFLATVLIIKIEWWRLLRMEY